MNEKYKIYREQCTENQNKYAGLGVRFSALLFDLILFCIVFFPVTYLTKGVWVMSSTDHQWVDGWFVSDPLCVAFFLIMVAYFVCLEGYLGFTVGKYILGLRVISVDGGRPGIKKGIVRNVMRIVDGLPALNIIGVLSIIGSKECARIGDVVANTRVVNINNRSN